MKASPPPSPALRVFALLRKAGYRCERLARRISAAFFRAAFLTGPRRRHSYISIDSFAAERRARWSGLGSNGARLSIVVVAYRQPVPLECLLASLACQTLQNFDVIVLHDGPDPETRTVAERFAARDPERFQYIETAVRHNDYGHTLRSIGIEAARGEFVLITNGDNYYAPRFSEFVFEAIATHDLDVALWDLVHSHTRPGGTVLSSYSPFRVYPLRYMVDIGSFLVRTELAQRVGFVDKSHDGDARYVEDLLTVTDRGLRIGKICKTLMVHN